MGGAVLGGAVLGGAVLGGAVLGGAVLGGTTVLANRAILVHCKCIFDRNAPISISLKTCKL